MAEQGHDTMDHSQLDGSASTPNSPAGDANGGLKAAKDKSCPFCAQPFTSSSLGRHLDLYIRPKNPKAPDGVHDVEKIRQMRGGITRRQPRTSLKGGASSTEGGSGAWQGGGGGGATQHQSSEGRSASASGRMTDRSPVDSPAQGAREEAQQARVYVNAPSWHATGVINNLPARAPSRGYTGTPTSGQAQRAQEMRKDASGNRTPRPEYGGEEMWRLRESAEAGRAAELALREVLGSLEAAKKKSEPVRLFDDLDFCALAFPGLCLALLPPPPTLFSSAPFALAHTWPLSPPGEKQYTAMQRVMSEKVAVVRNGNPDTLLDSTVFRYQVHLQGAWEHWQLLKDEDRAVAWNLELSRAFVREKEKKTKLQSDLEYARQRVRHLQADYDRLSRCQLPREYLLHPPQTTFVDPATVGEMRNTDTASGGWAHDYDADALIDRWKGAVRATSRPPRPRPDTSTATPTYIAETARNSLREDMMMNGSVFGVGGPMPRGQGGDELHQTPREGVRYETPQQPGAIVEEGDDEGGGGGGGGYEGALMRRDRLVNGNGKRPFSGTPTGWGEREAGAKVWREMGGKG